MAALSLPNATPAVTRIWRFRELDDAWAETLARELGWSALAARILATRGLADARAVQDFLNPSLGMLHDPFLMAGMEPAVERIVRAIRDQEPIAVYGDYDVDGLTATALLIRFFRFIGVEVTSYIPHRLDEGYGMSCEGVESLHARGVRLIVTVDNGISCAEQVAHAARLGIDVVITDHHQPGDTLPEPVALVNPNRPECPYPFKELSGCGVAFKLAHALLRRLECSPEEAKPFLVSLLDLVALGTIADVMNLQGENRVLSHFGLRELERTRKAGLKALIHLLGQTGKPFTTETVGFLIGPRLNAAGRTGNADDALAILLVEEEARAWELARYLDELNQERRSLETEVLTDALERVAEDATLLDDPILIVAGEGWHQGVVGIVASRLVDRFGHPAIVLSIEGEVARGSARSVNGFDIHTALGTCADLFIEYGGHTLAAGVTLQADRLALFRERLNREAAGMADPAQMAPMLEIDCAAAPEELTETFLTEIERVRPFGNGNPQPCVALLGCEVAQRPLFIGGKHLKLFLARQNGTGEPLTAMWFNCPYAPADIESLLAVNGRVDLAGFVRLNTWNGVQSIEFTVRDLRSAGEKAAG
jgi:single-stranded-DNA-specific exonuclease